MKSTRFATAPRCAFTLPELLVGIGIVGVLLALLLPALGRARSAAKGVACLSNLRQMATAAHAYANENDGRYPIAYFYAADGDGVVAAAWDLTTIDPPGQPTRVVPGILWGEGSGAAQVQQCPAFDGGANWLVDPYTGYNYNTSFIGHGQFESVPAPARAASIPRPSTTALFGDGQWAGGANKFMRAPFPSPGDASFSGRWSGTQGYRHAGRTNVAYCDGHAEAVAGRFMENADGADHVAAGTGFLSKDNAAYGSD